MPKWITNTRNWLFGKSASFSLTKQVRLQNTDQGHVGYVTTPSQYPVDDSAAARGFHAVKIAFADQRPNYKEAQAQGYNFARKHLDLYRSAFGDKATTIYAQGMACAARDEMLSTLGGVNTFERFQRIADDTLDTTLPQGK